MTLTRPIFCAAGNVWIKIWTENIDTDWQQGRCLCCLVLFLIHESFILHKTSCEPPISPSLHPIRVNLDPGYRFSKFNQQVSPVKSSMSEQVLCRQSLHASNTHLQSPPKIHSVKQANNFWQNVEQDNSRPQAHACMHKELFPGRQEFHVSTCSSTTIVAIFSTSFNKHRLKTFTRRQSMAKEVQSNNTLAL